MSSTLMELKTVPAGGVRVEPIVFSVLVFNLIEMESSGLNSLSLRFLN